MEKGNDNDNAPLLRLIGDMESDLSAIGGSLDALKQEVAENETCAAYVWNHRLSLRIIQNSLKKAVSALDSIFTPVPTA